MINQSCRYPDVVQSIIGIQNSLAWTDTGAENSSIALLQICYNFFTLGLDMLTGKNAGDIINLNSEGCGLPLLDRVVRRVGLSLQGKA